MSGFASILLPLDGSAEAANGAGCALWLAQAIGATLHVLHATPRVLPAHQALARLRIPDAQREQVVVHQRSGGAGAAVLEAISAYTVDLVVMSARGETASVGLQPSKRLGNVAQAVLEGSPVPVLLIPARYREALPWTSMLAAASGDAAADQALEVAARLAAALQLKVSVVHCEDGPAGAGTNGLGVYADAPHHEIPRRLDGMVERGLAGCTPGEGRCVDRVMLARGEPAAVLLEQVARHAGSVLALGWHGAIGAGRASILKRLIEHADCALLLVRSPERSSTLLKIGKEIDDD